MASCCPFSVKRRGCCSWLAGVCTRVSVCGSVCASRDGRNGRHSLVVSPSAMRWRQRRHPKGCFSKGSFKRVFPTYTTRYATRPPWTHSLFCFWFAWHDSGAPYIIPPPRYYGARVCTASILASVPLACLRGNPFTRRDYHCCVLLDC